MDPDAVLLRRWCEGEVAAGEELVRRHLRTLRELLRREAREDIDDLVQQTLLACVEGAHRFREQSTFRTYLRAIAMNLVFTRRRHKRRALEVPDGDLDDIAGDPPQSSSPRLAQAQSLDGAVRRLPPELRTVVTMTYWQGLAHRDVASSLGVPKGTVASRIRRAKEILRSSIRGRKSD
ncbi:MAG: RNA polymerase sigma factor [Polyangiaceae bacterium]